MRAPLDISVSGRVPCRGHQIFGGSVRRLSGPGGRDRKRCACKSSTASVVSTSCRRFKMLPRAEKGRARCRAPGATASRYAVSCLVVTSPIPYTLYSKPRAGALSLYHRQCACRYTTVAHESAPLLSFSLLYAPLCIAPDAAGFQDRLPLNRVRACICAGMRHQPSVVSSLFSHYRVAWAQVT